MLGTVSPEYEELKSKRSFFPCVPLDQAVIHGDGNGGRSGRVAKDHNIRPFSPRARYDNAVATDEMRRLGYLLRARILLLAFGVGQLPERRCPETERREIRQGTEA